MMERAAVPPRTINKVSDLFGASTFILDFFWGGIKSPKNTTLSSEFESSLQNVFSASRHSNFGPISKAAGFWILGEGHTAALRAGGTACVLCRAPCFQWAGSSKWASFHTAETAMPPYFAVQSPISKRHWYHPTDLPLEFASRICGGGGGIDFGLRPPPLRGCLRQSVTLRGARTSFSSHNYWRRGWD